jgi:MFS transporter, DHA2 family, methylenomycin A resistance protein
MARALYLGYFMVILDATIVNVALPDVGASLHGGLATLQWIVDGYTLAFAALLLTGGALADRLGARRVLVAGLSLFTVASGLCALAPGAALLVAFRAIQGAGAALTVPASLALIRGAYADPAVRARAVGAWGAVGGIGAASGPVIGGVLVAAAGWRAVFLVNLPVGAATIALTLRTAPALPGHPRRLDPAAQVLGVIALAGLTFAVIEAGRSGAGSAGVLVAAVAAVAAAGAFVAVARRSVAPMLPLELFRSRPFSGASAVGLLINLGFYGQLLVVNLGFQGPRGWSALTAGLATLPQGAFVSLGSMASGRMTAREGSPRPTILIGLTIGALGLAGLALTPADAPYPLLVLPLMASGLGMSLTMPAATSAAVDAAPDGRAGIAAGVINAARQVGGAIGVALLGSLAAAGASLAAGERTALLVATAAFLVAAAIAARTQARTVKPPAARR